MLETRGLVKIYPGPVTAHEAAHQWWGNILTPANGPNGDFLSEGMAHFSTLLLFDKVKGPRGRMEARKESRPVTEIAGASTMSARCTTSTERENRTRR